jgi:ADP-ribose pyrophosphatase YjhB (NUDIX family)
MVDMPTLQDRQRIAAYGVARRGGDVLLVRASADSGMPGTWWLPGGGLWFGETPQECVVREFEEETGLAVRVGDLFEAVSDVGVVVSEGVRLHSVRLIYDVEVGQGTVVPEAAGSTDGVRWFPSSDLVDLPLIGWLHDLVATDLLSRPARAR